jgi:hypothetical protein
MMKMMDGGWWMEHDDDDDDYMLLGFVVRVNYHRPGCRLRLGLLLG